MKTETIKRIVKLLPVCSTDPTRWHLNGIQVVKGKREGTVQFVATDGKIVVRLILEDQELADTLSENAELFLTKDVVKALESIAKSVGKTVLSVNVQPEQNGVRVSSPLSAMTTLMPVTDVRFPRTEEFFKLKENAESESIIGLDIGLLTTLAKALCPDKKQIVKMQLQGKLNAVIVTSVECPESIGAIMPVRV